MALVSGPTLGDAIADPANELTKLVDPRERRRQADRRALRPHPQPAGDPEEIATCRERHAVRRRRPPQAGRGRSAGARSSSPSSGPQLERERAGRDRRGPGRPGRLREGARPEARRSRRRRRPPTTAKLEADLKAYEATVLAKKLAEWEKAQSTGRPLGGRSSRRRSRPPTARRSPRQPDGSILASGKNAATAIYTIVAETDLTGITGVRLEVLPDDGLPSKGPGRAADGNFVLTEFEVTAAPKADPKQAKPVKLQNALADFSQEDFERRRGRSTATRPTRAPAGPSRRPPA